MDEPCKYYARWKKPDTKGPILLIARKKKSPFHKGNVISSTSTKEATEVRVKTAAEPRSQTPLTGSKGRSYWESKTSAENQQYKAL